jgi:hypothetical protein
LLKQNFLLMKIPNYENMTLVRNFFIRYYSFQFFTHVYEILLEG